jgi:hypothetical protein
MEKMIALALIAYTLGYLVGEAAREVSYAKKTEVVFTALRPLETPSSASTKDDSEHPPQRPSAMAVACGSKCPNSDLKVRGFRLTEARSGMIYSSPEDFLEDSV